MSVIDERPLLVADATALGRPDWLPEATGWEKLDDLRETHVRLIGARADASAKLAEIERRYQSIEKHRAAEMERAVRGGSEFRADPDAQDLSEAKRADIAEAEAGLDAVNRALDDFLREAEQTITDRCDDWLGDMDEKDAEAQAKLDEAKRLAAQALAEVQSRRKLRMWVQREAGRHHTFKDSTAVGYTSPRRSRKSSASPCQRTNAAWSSARPRTTRTGP